MEDIDSENIELVAHDRSYDLNESQDSQQHSNYERKCCGYEITVFCVKSWTICKYITFLLSAIWILWLFISIIIPNEIVRDIINKIETEPSAGTSLYSFSEFDNMDCSFTWVNIKKSMDIFLFLHFLTYFITACIIRNRLMLWIISVSWEFVEIIFCSIPALKLGVLNECWYDRLIFDIFGMNLLGIEIGLFIIKYSKLFVVYDEFTSALLCKIKKYQLLPWLIIIFYQTQQLTVFAIFYITWHYHDVGMSWMAYYRSLAVFAPCFLYGVNQAYYFIVNNKKYTNGSNILKELYFWIIIVVMLSLEIIVWITGYIDT